MKTRAFSALLALGALAATGCRTPTSITVSVTTDAACADLKGVAITARAPDAIEAATPTTITTNCSAQTSGGSRIGTLVIVPSAGDSDEIAIRVVAGLDKPVEQCTAADGYQGCVVARRLVRFASHVELAIPIVLRKGCKDVPCAASTTCVDGLCRDATVTDPQSCTGEGCLAEPDAGADVGPEADAPDADDAGDGAPIETGCASGQKNCGGNCVAIDDPAFGCGTASCSPCATFANATYACAAGACAATGCQKGFKSCGGVCQPIDAAHGCSATACDACPAIGGVASCDTAGACKITCDPGYKLCGGKCVSVGDPTYGCGATTCDNSTCPTGVGTTVVCSGNACVVGACGPGTKACSGACVPTDVAHGCGDVTRCTTCGQGETCVGGPPTTCQCVSQPAAVTCAGVECGTKLDNCGKAVDCGGLCGKPQTCGGGGVPNKCGCTPTNPCDGAACGTLTNNCALQVSCGCTGFNTCGGGGVAGQCGCTAVSPCNGTVCGKVVDACGKTVTCDCTAPNTCGGGGVPLKCGCTPTDIAVACDLRECGSVSNGCGGFHLCGKCALGEICSGGFCTCKTCP